MNSWKEDKFKLFILDVLRCNITWILIETGDFVRILHSLGIFIGNFMSSHFTISSAIIYIDFIDNISDIIKIPL